MSKSEKGRLDKYCEIVMGQSPSGESYNYEAKGLKLIAGAGDFGEVYPSAKKYTTEASKISKYGDIVLGIRASIGDKVLSDGEYCLGRGVAGLRPLSKLDARYLWHWLDHIRPILSAKSKGATFKQVNREDICELEINIIQLEEQKRIAEILDRTQSLISKRKEAIAKLDTLIQSIFLEMFGDPVTNPKNIKTLHLAKVCKRITDGTHQPPKWSELGYPFLFVSNIVSGEITFDTAKFISSETHEELTRRCPIETDDILYSTVGSYGVPVIVKTERKFAFQRHIAHIKPEANLIDSKFLCAMLASPPLKRQADRAARGVAQKTVNLEEIRKFIIFCPPLPLQKEFAQRVEAVEKLKATHRASLSQLEALFASLQHRAFRGEL